MSNTIKPYGENVVLFKNRLPDSLFLSQVYKSSEDGTWDENSPKIVPHPGSLVIDEKTGGLYYVESVDKNTLDSTLKPCKIINIIDGNEASKYKYTFSNLDCSYQDYCFDNDYQTLTRNNFYKSIRIKGYSELCHDSCEEKIS